MQRRAAPEHHLLDDCVLYKMIAGQSITIPPGYAHILINPSREPGLMAGLYSLDSVHNYDPIDSMKGAAYYLTERNGQEMHQPQPGISVLATNAVFSPALTKLRFSARCCEIHYGNPLFVPRTVMHFYTIQMLHAYSLKLRIYEYEIV